MSADKPGVEVMRARPTRPEVDLSSLTPAQRERYETMAAGWRAEWAAEQAARDLVSAEMLARFPDPTRRERAARRLRDIVGGIQFFAVIAAIFLGGASVFGACVGIVFFLARVGWRVGASL